VGMPAASNVATAESIDFATFGRACATVEWIDQGPRTRTKTAMIATVKMVRIGVPLWCSGINPGSSEEPLALGDWETKDVRPPRQ
jgi:hypothetical protein